jgi:hypothetical protein
MGILLDILVFTVEGVDTGFYVVEKYTFRVKLYIVYFIAIKKK